MIQNLKLTEIELGVSLICVTLTVSYTYTQTTDINQGLLLVFKPSSEFELSYLFKVLCLIFYSLKTSFYLKVGFNPK